MQDPILIIVSYKMRNYIFHAFFSSTSFRCYHTFHQCSQFSLHLSAHLHFTLYLFQSTSTAAAFPWRRGSQQVCGRWRSVRHRRRSLSAVRTRTRPSAPSPPSLSPPRASVALVPTAGRATATCATVIRFISSTQCSWKCLVIIILLYC